LLTPLNLKSKEVATNLVTSFDFLSKLPGCRSFRETINNPDRCTIEIGLANSMCDRSPVLASDLPRGLND